MPKLVPQSSGLEAARKKAMVSCLRFWWVDRLEGEKKTNKWWCSGDIGQVLFARNVFDEFVSEVSLFHLVPASQLSELQFQVQARIIYGKLAHLQRLSQRPQNWVAGSSKVVRPWWLQYRGSVMTCKSLRASDLLGSAQVGLTGDWWAASTSMGLSEITFDFWR